MSEYASLVKRFNNIKSLIDRQIGERESIISSIEDSKLKMLIASNKEALYGKSIETLQKVSGIMKTKTITNIETLITKGIHDVIGEKNLSFIVKYDSKRNFIQAQYKIHDSVANEDYNIVDSFGGGIADIISILQRIIFVYKFNTAKIIVLDEAGKWISSCKQDDFGKFLSEISNKLGIQIILITHKNEVLAHSNKIFRVTKSGAFSSVGVA